MRLTSSKKTPGSDGLTIEFYRFFWEVLGHFMIDSFNYAYEYGHLSISQQLGIISLRPKKEQKFRIFIKLEANFSFEQ